MKDEEILNEKEEDKKLVRAEIVVNELYDPTKTAYLYGQTVDRMDIPSKYHDLIKTCRFFYKRDAIAGTVINKMCDIAITNICNQRNGVSDSEIKVYNSLTESLRMFFESACLEFLLSGLVLPEYEWIRVKGSDLDPNLNSRTRFDVPNNFWFRDPASITIKMSPIPNKRYYFVTVSYELIDFIRNKGKTRDGTVDKETYKLLVKNYPEFVKEIQDNKKGSFKVRLTGLRPIESRRLVEESYPIPFMENALESLIHKRNIRKMDYSIAARTISSIQLIKLGNDQFPCTDSHDFDSIKNQMNYRTMEGYNERIFQLFGNHTLEIGWVFPDTEAMLNQEKYNAVNDDIISAFGFPRTLITGETIRSNVAGGTDIATTSPIATMESIRSLFLGWIKELYEEIRVNNNFKRSPIPKFEPMKLYKLLDILAIADSLYEKGSMSRTTFLREFGYDVDEEIDNKVVEKEKYKENNIDDIPPIPFSSPSFTDDDTKETVQDLGGNK